MAVAEFHFNADNSLGRMTSATFIVPEQVEGPFGVLFLLHGHSDDHTAWLRRSNVERYVEGLPLIVVMPNGEKGWYNDALYDPSKKFESLIINDLIPFVDRAFDTTGSRLSRTIAGLSMGGYGAMKLGLKYPELFCGVHSFSGALNMASPNEIGRGEEFRLIFGDFVGPAMDIFAIARAAEPKSLPQISFDCGVDDFLIEHSRAFKALLSDLGIAHDYTEYSGAHNWAYWNAHFLDALPMLLSAMAIEASVDRAGHLGG
jgi:putative tributyrin esterase